MKMMQPAKLELFSPRCSSADGNCLYTAVSLALFGDQSHHLHLRLLTALEMLLNKVYYDINGRSYEDKIQDNRIVNGTYNELIELVCKKGGFSEILHIYALSAVIGLPLKTYYPPTANP